VASSPRSYYYSKEVGELLVHGWEKVLPIFPREVAEKIDLRFVTLSSYTPASPPLRYKK
jgi:hypothetical protein